MVDQSREATAARSKQRSPSYPAIDLKSALDRARLLHRAEGKNRAAIDTILAHWGYKPGSGMGMVVAAALKKFGLLVDEGSASTRRARLSDQALRILLDERENSGDRAKLIREAALKPLVYRDLWTRYQGDLPSDATIKHELIFDKGFSERGATEFIGPFRDTIAFAQLSGRPSELDIEDDGEQAEPSGDPKAPVERTPPGIGHADTPEIQIPLAPGQFATIRARFPLSHGEWNQFFAVLEAMKPALVVAEPVE